MDQPKPSPLRIITYVVAVGVALWLIPQLWPVIFAALLAVICGLLLDVPVSALERRGWMSRGAATGVVTLAGLVVVVAGITFAVPTIIGQGQELLAQLGGGSTSEAVARRVNDLLANLPSSPRIEPSDMDVSRLWDHVGGFRAVGLGGEMLALGLLAVFSGAWAVASPEPLALRLLGFMPCDHRERTRVVAAAVLERLRAWLAGQLVLCVAVGLSTYVLFRALGVPFAEVFGLAAGILEAIPTIGVLLATAMPAVMLGLANPGRLPWLIVGVIIIHQLEDRLLIPYVMRRAVDLHPALIGFVLMSFGLVFGPAGMFVAVPITAAFFTIHDELIGPHPETFDDLSPGDPAEPAGT